MRLVSESLLRLALCLYSAGLTRFLVPLLHAIVLNRFNKRFVPYLSRREP